MADDSNEIKIDSELLEQYLEACLGDEELKSQVLEDISRKLGISPKKADQILSAAIEMLFNKEQRSSRWN